MNKTVDDPRHLENGGDRRPSLTIKELREGKDEAIQAPSVPSSKIMN